MPLVSHHELDTVYRSLQFLNATKAEELRPDFVTIAYYGWVENKDPAKPAVARLRRAALDLPEGLKRVLNNVLDELMGHE